VGAPRTQTVRRKRPAGAQYAARDGIPSRGARPQTTAEEPFPAARTRLRRRHDVLRHASGSPRTARQAEACRLRSKGAAAQSPGDDRRTARLPDLPATLEGRTAAQSRSLRVQVQRLKPGGHDRSRVRLGAQRRTVVQDVVPEASRGSAANADRQAETTRRRSVRAEGRHSVPRRKPTDDGRGAVSRGADPAALEARRPAARERLTE